MDINEKIFICGKIAHLLSRTSPIVTPSRAVWFSDQLYQELPVNGIRLGVRTIISPNGSGTIIIPEVIYIINTYELDEFDWLVIAFIRKYAHVILLGDYPMLPMPKITFHEQVEYTVHEISERLHQTVHGVAEQWEQAGKQIFGNLLNKGDLKK